MAKNPIKSALKEALGQRHKELFPDGLQGKVTRETFQSKTFRRAGYDTMPETYGPGDRFLYTVDHGDGKMTFVLAGKVSSGNPFDVSPPFGAGMDLRPEMTVVYQFDGVDTIKETLPDGEEIVHEGKNGNPDILLSYIRPPLGTLVSEE